MNPGNHKDAEQQQILSKISVLEVEYKANNPARE